MLSILIWDSFFLYGCTLHASPLHTVSGRHGRYAEGSGLKIVYMGGVEAEGEKGLSTFNSQDVADLLQPVVGDSSYKGVDILLTSQWPRDIHKYASEPVSVWSECVCGGGGGD